MKLNESTEIFFESKIKWSSVIIPFFTFLILTLFLPKYYWIYGAIVSTTYLLITLIRTKKMQITSDRLIVTYPFFPNGRNYFIRINKVKSITYVDHSLSKSDRTHINIHKKGNLKPSKIDHYLSDEEYNRFERAVKNLGIEFKYTNHSEDIVKSSRKQR